MKTNIGVFDSGIGGVTVLRECIRRNSNFNFYYYSDSLHNPYGDKGKEEVINYCDEIVKYFIDRNCHIIIIACNTASAMVSSFLRKKYKNINIIAIEPAIKLAYDTNNDGTLIMATKGTLDSDKFKKLYKEYHHKNFYLYSCIGLANLIENNNMSEIKKYLEENLSCYKGKVSNVVLGCTHYPLIKNEIGNVLGDVCFFDGSIGVSNRLASIIKDNNYSGYGNNIYFYDSSLDKKKEERFYKILEEDYE